LRERRDESEGGEVSELLPCPFCGGTNIFIGKDYDSEIAYAFCTNCGARGPRVRYYVNIPVKKAYEKWDRRANVTHESRTQEP
jgi:Lar family restriction alleviation protein